MDPDDTQPKGSNDPLKGDALDFEQPAGTPEDFFLLGLDHWTASGVKTEEGQWCETPIGRFRLAFVVSSLRDARRIAVECGVSISGSPEERRRDRAVVVSGKFARVYRVRSRDIAESLHDVLHLLGILEPGLISAKGMDALAHLCGPEDSRKDDLTAEWHVFPYCAVRSFFDDQWLGASLKRRTGLVIWWTEAPGTAQGDHSDAEGRQGDPTSLTPVVPASRVPAWT